MQRRLAGRGAAASAGAAARPVRRAGLLGAAAMLHQCLQQRQRPQAVRKINFPVLTCMLHLTSSRVKTPSLLYLMHFLVADC